VNVESGFPQFQPGIQRSGDPVERRHLNIP